MPPEGATEAYAADEGDKAPLMGVDEAERVDLVVGPEQALRRSIHKRRVPIKDAVKVLVFLDMLSVALVVPLLSSYFRDLDISTEQYGLMSSAYSLSQIVGGLVLGALSDRAMSRRSVILISFLGSSLSYGTIGLSSSLNMLLVGRVVVGLVKQTMTISTAIVSEHTTAADRSSELSKLTAAMTFSFIVGPAIGSFLYQRNKKFPPLAASCIFLLNAAVALVLLPSGSSSKAKDSEAAARKKNDEPGRGGEGGQANISTIRAPTVDNGNGGAVQEGGEIRSGEIRIGENKGSEISGGGGGGEGEGGSDTSRFCANFKLACSSGPILRILVAKLMYGFFMRALGSQNFVGYFEERFDVDSGALGYITSYTALMSFVVQLYVVGRLTSRMSETSLVSWSLVVLTVMYLAEGAPTAFGLWGYLALLVPARAVANAALGACLQSMFTQRVPQSDLGAALGTLNVLLSASGVVGPVYGGKLMGVLGVLARPAVTAGHYAVFFVVWWAMEMRGGGAAKGLRSGGGGSGDGGVGDGGAVRRDKIE